LPVLIVKFDLCNSIQAFQGFHQRLSDGVIGPIGLARPAQINMYHPVLDLDTAVSAEAIVKQDYTTIPFAGSGSFEEGVQSSGDRVL